jgi:hypothetical protein
MMTTEKLNEVEIHMTKFLEVVEAYIKNKKSTFMKNPSAGSVATIADEKLHQEMQGEVSKVLYVAENQIQQTEGSEVQPEDVVAPPKAMEKIRGTINRIETDPATTSETKALLDKVKQDLNEIDGPQSRVSHTR